MSIHETYFALALAWSIKTDFEFVRWLVDTQSLRGDAIVNEMTKNLYIAAARSYARAAPRGILPSAGDVIIELSTLVGEEHAAIWRDKIYQMDKPSTSMSHDVASAMAEEYDRQVVARSVSSWLSEIESDDFSGSIYSSFTRMADNVTRLIVGEQATGRPSDILEKSWSTGIRKPETTGYNRLDRGLDGGWVAGKLYILGMPSGHGKSSMCCNFATRRAELGLPTLINSFEMSADDMLFRMLCDLAEVTINVAENPRGAAHTEEEYGRVMRAKGLLDSFVRIYDTVADPKEIERRVRRHKVEFRGDPSLVILDHIGIVGRDGRSRRDSWEELETMAYTLSNVAKDGAVPILANSQVPSEMEAELVARNMIIYNRDFRGSRGIRNAVDYAIVGCKHSGLTDILGGEKEYNQAYRDHTVLQVIKNRKTGRTFWGVFRYDPMHYKLHPDKNEGTADDIYT